jgi:hypothetical protein
MRTSFKPVALTHSLSIAAFCFTAMAGQAATAPVVLTDVSAYGFPDFLKTLNNSTRGWAFAPAFVGLKWVEVNGVLLNGNSGTNDPAAGLSFTTRPTPYAVNGFDWAEAAQRPARNGLCRGGLHGNRFAFGLTLAATPGHTYLVEVLALGAAAPKRAFNVVLDGQTVVKDWTILADRAANRVLRVRAQAAADHLDLQFTPGTAAGADLNPAITAIALTDLSEEVWQHDPIFGRVPPGLQNIASQGTASSPDGLEQDGDGRGDQAAIDGDPGTYWDEGDGAKLYRLVVTFKQPEKFAALAILGWGQHEFAPKDFEVLCDGRPVRKVEDARYSRNVLWLPFDETSCQSVELRITGCYGKSPAVRELGLFTRQVRAVAASPAAAAPPKDGTPTSAEWPLIYKQQKLLVYAAGPFKPYVKELYTLKGNNLLRDAPYDHLHHHGLMFAIKANGVNFWEETPGCGFQKPIQTANWLESRTADGLPQFTLRQLNHWVAPRDLALPDTSGAAILIEHRTLTVTVNEAQQEVALRWKSAFETGPGTNRVTLTGANYHGLGVRFQKELDSFARHLNAGGAPDLDNRQDVSRHKWGSVSFDRPGHPATLVVFGHPGNARGEAWFFTMRAPFAYLAATQNLDQEPIVYARGDKFELNYLVTAYPDVRSPAALRARAQSWEASKP